MISGFIYFLFLLCYISLSAFFLNDEKIVLKQSPLIDFQMVSSNLLKLNKKKSFSRIEKFDSFSRLKCCGQPIHCLIQSFAFCGRCFEYLQWKWANNKAQNVRRWIELTWNVRFLSASRPSAWCTSAKLMHPSISCLFANTTNTAFANSSSWV